MRRPPTTSHAASSPTPRHAPRAVSRTRLVALPLPVRPVLPEPFRGRAGKFNGTFAFRHDANPIRRPCVDAGWVERWDVAFAGLPPLRHVLLGMNAHINYGLPQALVAVITDDEFDDAALLARREADHWAIDAVLAARVAAEDAELTALTALSGPPPLLGRLLGPLNRLGTQRFLREARQKVWANAIALSRARRQGPDVYAAVLARLEELSAAKVTALQAPGQVLLKLAATGFGVTLPQGSDMRGHTGSRLM